MSLINNWLAQLTGELRVDSDVLEVSPAALNRLSIDASTRYVMTITASLNPVEQANFEIFHIVGNGAGTYELLRGQEGTEARLWPAGSYVYCAVTAGVMESIQQQIDALAERLSALEGNDLPENSLVDGQGNPLTDDQGNQLTYGA